MPANEVLDPLPPEYAAASIFLDQEQSPLRLCLIVRKAPDPIAGHCVTIRDTFDSNVVLGAICDSAGVLHRYVEIWIQTLDGLRATTTGLREILNNSILDERWASAYRAIAGTDPTSIFSTGWELRHPQPVVIDPLLRIDRHAAGR